MIKRDNVRVCVPRYMQIGKGSLSQLPEILNIIGSVKSPLIVTDKQMVKFGYVKKLQETLLKAGIKSSVFEDTIPDPTDSVVLNGIDILKKNKNDAVIGFGGGRGASLSMGTGIWYGRFHFDFALAYKRGLTINSTKGFDVGFSFSIN